MLDPKTANGSHHDVSTTTVVRPLRLPRWTRQEILVLIEGKRSVESRGGRASRGFNRVGLVGQPGRVEPKWASVSAYCRRHGVDRGPVQCRKRWSNLAGDYKKIKEWESTCNGGESFWVMRNDLRKERRLPGFFDREVYDILDGKVVVEEEVVEREGDGLFSDGYGEEEAEKEEGVGVKMVVAVPVVDDIEVVGPISEEKFEAPQQQECSDSGMSKEKRSAENPIKGSSSSSQEGNKRRKTSQDESENTSSLQIRLIKVLERNSRIVTAQLAAQNVNIQFDREQRMAQTEGLLCALNKVADALGKIADKL